MDDYSPHANWPLGLLGAIIGAAIGSLGFHLLLQGGFYGIALPGTLVGYFCGKFSGGHSKPLGIVCGVIALLLGLLLEWHYFPFLADDSLGYFLTHIHELRTMTQLMIALGTICGYWLGAGKN